MNTQTLQVFSLRGMDERWIVNPQDALYIQDMTWTSNDSWRTSGGFEQLYRAERATDIRDDLVEDERDNQVAVNDESGSSGPDFVEDAIPLGGVVPRYGYISSIHWFAQHNGARQWLIFEEQNFTVDDTTGELSPDGTVSLRAFDGSLNKPFSETPALSRPVKTLIEYKSTGSEDFINVNNRTDTRLSVRTQSQSYGGRIYFVNGFDEPLIFDGESCERAGFSQKPPPPTAGGCDFSASTTFPFCVGDPEDDEAEIVDAEFSSDMAPGVTFNRYYIVKPRSISFWSAHKDVPYWGVGSRSDATVGAGKYSYRGGTDKPKYATEFKNMFDLKWNYFAGEQLDSRKCGYQYRVTYVNDRGQESEASEPSSIATVENGRGGQKRCRHGKGLIGLQIPVGPKECVARRIYRTRNLYDSKGDMYSKGGQQSFYFLKEIQDNMTKSITDGHPDTALGELLNVRDLGNFPVRTKFLAVFKNTMFAAGSDLNELRYSAPLFPEVFPSDNIIIVGDDDGGPITGMRATKNALIVFKTRGIYLIKGSPSTGFAAQTLNKDIGCIAPNSIAEIPGLGLCFLGEKSIYLLEGALENTGSVTGVVNIGAEIPNQLELINKAAAVRSSAAVYLRDKEYWISIPTLGSDKNNLCLIYHYEVGSWSVREDFPIDCMVVSKDHRGYLFMGSNDTENLYRTGVLTYTRGSDNKGFITTELELDGDIKSVEKVPINAIYETVSNDYQSVFTNFRPAHVMAYAVGYGDNGLNVNTRVNRSIDKVRTTVQSAEQQDPNEVYPVYGSAKFDSDRWTAYRPTVVRYDISTSHKGPVRELSISFAAADGNKIEIIGYDLEAKVGEQRSIKPLNKALRPSRR